MGMEKHLDRAQRTRANLYNRTARSARPAGTDFEELKEPPARFSDEMKELVDYYIDSAPKREKLPKELPLISLPEPPNRLQQSWAEIGNQKQINQTQINQLQQIQGTLRQLQKQRQATATPPQTPPAGVSSAAGLSEDEDEDEDQDEDKDEELKLYCKYTKLDGSNRKCNRTTFNKEFKDSSSLNEIIQNLVKQPLFELMRSPGDQTSTAAARIVRKIDEIVQNEPFTMSHIKNDQDATVVDLRRNRALLAQYNKKFAEKKLNKKPEALAALVEKTLPIQETEETPEVYRTRLFYILDGIYVHFKNLAVPIPMTRDEEYDFKVSDVRAHIVYWISRHPMHFFEDKSRKRGVIQSLVFSDPLGEEIKTIIEKMSNLGRTEGQAIQRKRQREGDALKAPYMKFRQEEKQRKEQFENLFFEKSKDIYGLFCGVSGKECTYKSFFEEFGSIIDGGENDLQVLKEPVLEPFEEALQSAGVQEHAHVASLASLYHPFTMFKTEEELNKSNIRRSSLKIVQILYAKYEKGFAENQTYVKYVKNSYLNLNRLNDRQIRNVLISISERFPESVKTIFEWDETLKPKTMREFIPYIKYWFFRHPSNFFLTNDQKGLRSIEQVITIFDQYGAQYNANVFSETFTEEYNSFKEYKTLKGETGSELEEQNFYEEFSDVNENKQTCNRLLVEPLANIFDKQTAKQILGVTDAKESERVDPYYIYQAQAFEEKYNKLHIRNIVNKAKAWSNMYLQKAIYAKSNQAYATQKVNLSPDAIREKTMKIVSDEKQGNLQLIVKGLHHLLSETLEGARLPRISDINDDTISRYVAYWVSTFPVWFFGDDDMIRPPGGNMFGTLAALAKGTANALTTVAGAGVAAAKGAANVVTTAVLKTGEGTIAAGKAAANALGTVARAGASAATEVVKTAGRKTGMLSEDKRIMNIVRNLLARGQQVEQNERREQNEQNDPRVQAYQKYLTLTQSDQKATLANFKAAFGPTSGKPDPLDEIKEKINALPLEKTKKAFLSEELVFKASSLPFTVVEHPDDDEDEKTQRIFIKAYEEAKALTRRSSETKTKFEQELKTKISVEVLSRWVKHMHESIFNLKGINLEKPDTKQTKEWKEKVVDYIAMWIRLYPFLFSNEDTNIFSYADWLEAFKRNEAAKTAKTAENQKESKTGDKKQKESKTGDHVVLQKEFKEGDRVVLHDMKTKNYNGTIGTVQGSKNDRWIVELDVDPLRAQEISPPRFNILPENITKIGDLSESEMKVIWEEVNSDSKVSLSLAHAGALKNFYWATDWVAKDFEEKREEATHPTKKARFAKMAHEWFSRTIDLTRPVGGKFKSEDHKDVYYGACLEMGRFYEFGKGVHINLGMARAYYEESGPESVGDVKRVHTKIQDPNRFKAGDQVIIYDDHNSKEGFIRGEKQQNGLWPVHLFGDKKGEIKHFKPESIELNEPAGPRASSNFAPLYDQMELFTALYDRV